MVSLLFRSYWKLILIMKTNTHRSKTTRGFSLVEVVMAMTLFSVASLGTTKLLINASYLTESNVRETATLSFATTCAERINSVDIEFDDEGVPSIDAIMVSINGSDVLLNFDQDNTVTLPMPGSQKSIDLTINPSVEKFTELNMLAAYSDNASYPLFTYVASYWINVEYSYESMGGRAFQRNIRYLKSTDVKILG